MVLEMWIIIFTVLFILVVSFLWVKKTEHRLPPGPQGWPILGNTFQINQYKFHFTLEKWVKEYGPIFKCSILQTNMVVLSSPELIRKAFNSDEYGKILNDRPESFLGKYTMRNHSSMIVARYNETLFKARKTFHTALHLYGDGVPKFETTVRSELDNLLGKLRSFEGKDFDPAPVFERSLGNLVSILVTGEPMSGNDERIIWDFVKVSTESLNPTVEFLLYNFPILRYIPCRYRDIYLDLEKKSDALIERYFTRYKTSYKAEMERGIIDVFLKIQREEMSKGSTWLNDDWAIGLVTAAIGGALLTTISALLSILLSLVNNIECQDKIYKEIETVIGLERCPTLNDKSKMPYTEATIMECLRLANIIPIIMPHNCLEECIFEGYKIPKDTKILANLWAVNRDRTVWGDPEVFRPERFLDDNGNLLPPEHETRQAWLLFGVGRRSCVGEVMARTRMFLYVTSLVQKFRFLPPRDSRLVKLDAREFSSAITARPPPFTCRAEERE